MELLLAHDPPALPNLQVSEGNTALHMAIGMTEVHVAKVNLLLKYRADPSIMANFKQRESIGYSCATQIY